MLSEYDSVAVALSQLDDWHTAAVPLVTLIESLPRHRLDVIEAFLSSTQQGITDIITDRSVATDQDITGVIIVSIVTSDCGTTDIITDSSVATHQGITGVIVSVL